MEALSICCGINLKNKVGNIRIMCKNGQKFNKIGLEWTDIGPKMAKGDKIDANRLH